MSIAMFSLYCTYLKNGWKMISDQGDMKNNLQATLKKKNTKEDC